MAFIFNKTLIVVLVVLALTSCKPDSHVNQTTATMLSEKTQYFCALVDEHCVIKTSSGSFEVLFSVKKVFAEENFEITVIPSENFTNQLRGGYFEGKNMFMGKVPLLFEKNAQGHYRAQTLIAACGEEVMQWRIWFSFSNPISQRPSSSIKHFNGVYADFSSYRN